MKNIFIFMVFISTQALAVEIVRIRDGGSLFCKSKYDVYNSTRHNLHYLKSATVTELDEEKVAIEVELQFVKCVERNGEFKFVKKQNPLSWKFKAPNGQTVTKTAIKREIVIYTDEIEILGNVDVTEQTDSVTKAKVIVDRNYIERNHFPLALDKGSHYTTIAFRTITKSETEDYDFGSNLSMAGAYRIFFNLK